MNEYNISWFLDRLHDRSAKGLARQLSALIQSSMIPVGTRLPPIRNLAFALQVSPATVSIAWNELRKRGIIAGRGRLGMHVCNSFIAPRPVRRSASLNHESFKFDLTSYTPDLSLLPSIQTALQALKSNIPNMNLYDTETITPALRTTCANHWPYAAEDFMATNGAYSALFDSMQALIPAGSIVAVEDPTPVRVLDLLDHLSVSIIAVRSDAQGISPASLANALTLKPTAFYLQPNINAITGNRMSLPRLQKLATILNTHPETWIIENDAFPFFSSTPAHSLGEWLNDRVIHIRSFSKVLGPDLRMGVLSASSRIIEEIQAFRGFGSAWTSRILQTLTSHLLNDDRTYRIIHHAYQNYQNRRKKIAQNLRKKGMKIETGEGFSFWIPVIDDNTSYQYLKKNNIGVSLGRKCSLLPNPHIRFSISHLNDGFEVLSSYLYNSTKKDI